jgi:hypothetical protein
MTFPARVRRGTVNSGHHSEIGRRGQRGGPAPALATREEQSRQGRYGVLNRSERGGRGLRVPLTSWTCSTLAAGRRAAGRSVRRGPIRGPNRAQLRGTQRTSERLRRAKRRLVDLDRSGWGPGGRRFKSCLPDQTKALVIRGFRRRWAGPATAHRAEPPVSCHAHRLGPDDVTKTAVERQRLRLRSRGRAHGRPCRA